MNGFKLFSLKNYTCQLIMLILFINIGRLLHKYFIIKYYVSCKHSLSLFMNTMSRGMNNKTHFKKQNKMYTNIQCKLIYTSIESETAMYLPTYRYMNFFFKLIIFYLELYKINIKLITFTLFLIVFLSKNYE